MFGISVGYVPLLDSIMCWERNRYYGHDDEIDSYTDSFTMFIWEDISDTHRELCYRSNEIQFLIEHDVSS